MAIAVVGSYVLFSSKTNDEVYCPGEINIGDGSNFGGAFDAINQDGETVTEKDVITGPTLLYFGYTFCPDVCPLDTSRNARVTDILQNAGISLKPVFISVDPDRDTPEVLKDFVGNMHDDMIGLTGSIEQIDHMKKLYKAIGNRSGGDSDEYYLMDHTAFSYLVTPKGVVSMYAHEATEEQISENIQCHAKRGDL